MVNPYLLVILFFFVNKSLSLEIPKDQSWLHEILLETEKQLLFGADEKVPNFQVLDSRSIFQSWPHQDLSSHKLVKRQVTNTESQNRTKFPERVNLKFAAFDQNFDLRLERNSKLLSPNFAIKENLLNDDSNYQDLIFNDQHDCFYQGSSRSHPNSSAAISLCDGMRGIIETEKDIFMVNPLPPRLSGHPELQSNANPHIILRREPLVDYKCPHSQNKFAHFYHSSHQSNRSHPNPRSNSHFHSTHPSHSPSSSSGGSRNRRSLSAPSKLTGITIETAVFIDEKLYDMIQKTFPGDTEHQIVTYVLTIMNAVHLLFKQSSLGIPVEISIVLMDILKAQPKDFEPSDNIDKYLTNFCVWQHNRRNHGRGFTTRWDHALLLSGINMYVIDGQGRKKNHVVGLAPVSGMCNSLNSCTISEGTSFQTVLVAAHEMGHSLGMEHDGSQDGNSCDHDNYIMSPTLGAGKTSWSSCSRDYLEKFIDLPQAACLLSTSSTVNILNQFAPEGGKLPGEIFDASAQCSLRFGVGSRKSRLQNDADICRLLRCDKGSSGNVVAYHAHPALEGTACGDHKWCKEGKCVPKSGTIEPSESEMIVSQATSSEKPSSSNGLESRREMPAQWTSWSGYTPCISECIFKGHFRPLGIMMSIRNCVGVSLNSSNYCRGPNKRLKVCDASNVCNSMPSRMTEVSQYIDEVCRAASTRDSTLEPRGTQYPGYDYTHSCYVWCYKRKGGLITQGWKLPDGTPCGIDESRISNRFCFAGECRAFNCDGSSLESGDHNACAHITDGSTIITQSNDRIMAQYGSGSWVPTTGCRYPCISGSRGIRLVVKECYSIIHGRCSSKESVQICSQSEDACPKRSMKSAEKYAAEVCSKYQIKYPTLLSGKGRQLTPRSENKHASCMVACQDRVWKDVHYQMDAFDDGKFPLGTDCSLGDNIGKKAYCVNGRCIQFGENNRPTEDFEDIENLRSFFGRRHQLRKRSRRSTLSRQKRQHLLQVSNSTRVEQASLSIDQNRVRRPINLSTFKSANETTLHLEPYVWGISLTPCSRLCGGGVRSVHIYCHNGQNIVTDSLCDQFSKPKVRKHEQCNAHPCQGSWRAGDWSQCSTLCGFGVQSRTIVCIKRISDSQVYSLTGADQCPLELRPKQLRVCENQPPCN